MQPAAGGDGAAAADSAGGAPDEAELLSLRFGLPTHARVGHLWFQRRAVLVAEAAQSLDAATYIEALVVQNRGSGLMCAVHGRAGCGKSALVSTVVSRLQVPGGGGGIRDSRGCRAPPPRAPAGAAVSRQLCWGRPAGRSVRSGFLKERTAP